MIYIYMYMYIYICIYIIYAYILYIMCFSVCVSFRDKANSYLFKHAVYIKTRCESHHSPQKKRFLKLSLCPHSSDDVYYEPWSWLVTVCSSLNDEFTIYHTVLIAMSLNEIMSQMTHTLTIFAGWKLANNQWFHWMWIQESPKVNGRPKAKATRYAWRNAAVLRLAVERRWNSELFGAAEGTQCGNRESFEGLENVQCIVLCNYAGFSVSGLVNHEIQLKINPSIQTDHKWAQQVTCP